MTAAAQIVGQPVDTQTGLIGYMVEVTVGESAQYVFYMVVGGGSNEGIITQDDLATAVNAFGASLAGTSGSYQALETNY